MKAFGNWLIDTNTPFRVVESAYTNPLMQTIREASDGVRAPTAYDIAEKYLPEECMEMKEYIKSIAPIWDERGVTIMCDGWSGPTNMSIINFLVYSVRGTVFHKSVDATNVLTKDANYYFKLLKKVVEEVGVDRVVQVVTDNEAAIKAAGKKLMQVFPNLYWTACAAHCLDLLLEDIGKRKNIKKVIDEARKISKWIYLYKWAINYMKKFTDGKELTRPGITRFATNFIMLESVVRHKAQLQDMFHSTEWLSSPYSRKNEHLAVEVRELLSRNPSVEVDRFWDKAHELFKIQGPILKVLRLVDGDKQPTMGFVYEAMHRCKMAIKSECEHYKQYWAMIDKRWEFQLHHDLHAVGCFLNPQYMYGDDNDIGSDGVLTTGLKNVIDRLEPNIENQIRAHQQLFNYRHKMDKFGSTAAQQAIKFMDPATWWETYGESAPHLRRIACKVLSQTSSSLNCERNWSMWSLVHTKIRNRLKYKRLQMIIYLRYNMKLKMRHLMRRSENEINESFDPINLDYIFDYDDPLNAWLEEEEDPVLNGDDINWQELDGDNNDGDDFDDDERRAFGHTPAFNYDGSSNPTSTRQSILTPPSSDDDGGGDDDGGEAQYGYVDRGQGSYVEPDIPPGFTERRYQSESRSQFSERDAREQLRKGKSRVVDHAIESDASWHGMSIDVILSGSSGSNNPHIVGYQPHASQPPQYDSTSGSQDVHIYNHGTINYGDSNYYNPSYYGRVDNSDSSWRTNNSNIGGYGAHGDRTNQNDTSWMHNAGSFFFTNDGRNCDNNDVPEPARHSFWW